MARSPRRLSGLATLLCVVASASPSLAQTEAIAERETAAPTEPVAQSPTVQEAPPAAPVPDPDPSFSASSGAADDPTDRGSSTAQLPGREGPEPGLGSDGEWDPRLFEADHLLADSDGYERAIEIYSDYLTDHPDDHGVRLRTARVLAWSGEYDRSLEEFDRLVDALPTPDLATERAEVLSWASRYDEAQRAFESILETHPDDARAAVGLARTHRWAGRAHEADRAYARALEIADSGEARSEWNDMRDLYPPSVRALAERVSDDQDFSFEEIGSEASLYLDLRTRVFAKLSAVRIRGNDVDGRRTLEGLDYGLRAERHLGGHFLLAGELGHEYWYEASTQLRAAASLRYTLGEATSLTAGFQHSGIGQNVQSMRGTSAGIFRDELELSVWQGLPVNMDLWGRIGGGWLSDGNGRVSAEGSLGIKPWNAHELRFAAGLNSQHYASRSERYYDPRWSVGGQLQASYGRPVFRGLELSAGTSLGYGGSEEASQVSHGVTWAANAGFHWQWRRWAVEGDAWFSQSWRATIYRSQRFSLRLERSF